MTTLEVEQSEGWINDETYHATMFIYNDETLASRIDKRLMSSAGLYSPMIIEDFIRDKLPGRYNNRSHLKNIDTWSILYDRLSLLLENKQIDQIHYDKIIAKLKSTSKQNIDRRLKLLSKAGMETCDPFFDHYKWMKQRALLDERLKELSNMSPKPYEVKIDPTIEGLFVSGDIVQRMEGTGDRLSVKDGMTYTVRGYSSPGHILLEGISRDEGGSSEGKFKLIKSNNPQTRKNNNSDRPTIKIDQTINGKFNPKDVVRRRLGTGDNGEVKEGHNYTVRGYHDKNHILLEEINHSHGGSLAVSFDLICSANTYKLLTEQAQEIADHIHSVVDSFEKVENNLPTKEVIMKVETKHYVNGTEVSLYDADAQAHLILDTEKEIEKMKSIKTPTKAIEAKIKELEKFLKDAVASFNKIEA
jgi:hypothetical protein